MKLASHYDRKKTPDLHEYRAMTEVEIRSLKSGDRVQMLDLNGRVADVKINGRVRTWKRSPMRLEIPCKYGMYECFTLDLLEALVKFVIKVEE